MTDEKSDASPNIDQSAGTERKGSAKPKRKQQDKGLELRESIIEAIQNASRESHWLGAAEIANLIGSTASDVIKVIKSKPLNQEFFLVAKAGKNTPPELVEKLDNSLVYASDDVDRLASSDQLFQFVAQVVEMKRRANGKPLQAVAKTFATDGVDKGPLSSAFETAVATRLHDGRVAPYEHLLKSPPPPKAPKTPKPPKPRVPTPNEIATRLFDVLTSQRHASADSYPVPLDRLFELAEFSGLPTATRNKAVKDPAFADRVAYCGSRLGDISASNSCILKSDLDPLLPKLAQRAFEYAITKSSPDGDGGRTTIFSAAALSDAMLIAKPDRGLFATQFDVLVDHAEPSLGLGWLEIKGKRQYFRLADIHSVGATGLAGTMLPPASSSPASSSPIASQRSIASQSEAGPQFALDFDAAFRRIDARSGNRNFVKVYDLRQALPQYDQAAFEAGLRQLREVKRYTMDSAQGGYASLTEAERRAGIQEGSSLLVYVTRKS